MYYYEKPQFFCVKEQASNIGQKRGTYTSEMFWNDFPQFMRPDGTSLIPITMLEQFVEQVNAAIQPDKWLDKWRYAAGLYIAHYVTMYLRTYQETSETPAEAAGTGDLIGVIASAKLGQDSVTYDTDALTKATAEWGDLNSTQYGQMLASMARLVGMGGTYVI